MSYDDIIRSMRDTSDEELLAITSGVEMGYTDRARVIAEAVLRERRVPLPADLKELRRRGAAAEAEANRRNAELGTARDQVIGRSWGTRLPFIGVGGFVLPFFGLQFDVLRPLGRAIPIGAAIVAIVGYILVVRTNPSESQTPADSER